MLELLHNFLDTFRDAKKNFVELEMNTDSFFLVLAGKIIYDVIQT